MTSSRPHPLDSTLSERKEQPTVITRIEPDPGELARALAEAGVPANEVTNRELLLALATPPPPGTDGELSRTVEEIRTYIADPARRSVPGELVHQWRVTLDRHHRHLPAPARRALRRPGTWLDHQMRLAHLLNHLGADSYWGEQEHLPFTGIDTATHLWGHR
ncbi:hypothetical protein [Streptomyces klenkii]|uniref:hypothetical protein n=1 Tax=Streptomyces klenkii TaxID=1420899 RepID=UPI0034402A59